MFDVLGLSFFSAGIFGAPGRILDGVGGESPGILARKLGTAGAAGGFEPPRPRWLKAVA